MDTVSSGISLGILIALTFFPPFPQHFRVTKQRDVVMPQHLLEEALMPESGVFTLCACVDVRCLCSLCEFSALEMNPQYIA